MENETILRKFLKIEFPKVEFTDEEMDFLERFKIKNETEASILKNILGENFTTVTEYYKTHPHIERAKERLQERHKTFNDRKKKDPNAFSNTENPDDCSFVNFLVWWYSKVDKEGYRKCYYCGIDEKTCEDAFKYKVLPSKKFTGTLHIERKNSDLGYNEDNCEFACALCNNAKSDMITEDDFNTYFKEPMKKYWSHIKEELKKNKGEV